MTTCIDLRELAGTRYRLAHDHKPDVRSTDDAWLIQIPATFGHFYPHGGNLIGFATSNRGPTARKLAALEGVTVEQDADDGLNLVFPVERFAAVAKIARPKRRRQLSPEHLHKMLANSKPFVKGQKFTASKAQESPRIPAQSA